MVTLTVVVLGMVGSALRRRFRPPGWVWLVVPGSAIALTVGGTGFLLVSWVAAAAVVVRRRLGAHRRRSVAAEADVTLLGELVALGVGAGLTFPGALELASREVHPELRGEIDAVLRHSRPGGIAVAFAGAGGRARRLYLLAGRAATTGAPIAAAVAAFVAERRDEERARRRAASARLPVRLLLPLSLLILPGFVLLTVGPTLLGALHRLGLLVP